MSKADTTKLKKALIEAFMLDAEETIRNCPEPLVLSDAHRRRMEEIIESSRVRCRRRKIGKRVLVAVLASLLVLLTGCAMFCEAIVDFIVTTFDRYHRVEVAVEANPVQEIEDIKVPSVMLEGYELVSEQKGAYSVRLEWVNMENEYILFVQKVLEQMYFAIDHEQGDYTKININDFVVFHFSYDNINTYIWKDCYEYHISSSRALSEEELALIIENIE